MKVRAPGKLILSGEYSVLYGNPALAMAINRYVTVYIKQALFPRIILDLSDLAHRSCLSTHRLQQIKQRIKYKYQRFISGHFHIRDVLQKPFELAQFTLSMIAEVLNVSLPGINIKVQSTVPVGCGMGSSAATILSVMQAIALYLHTSLSKETLFKLGLQAEKMQHGYSTGLDLQTALHGGCIYYVPGQPPVYRQKPELSMYLINTGSPITTTGQCVSNVAKHFQTMSSLSHDFATVTQIIDTAMQQQQTNAFKAAIKENHRLLVAIGVVPERVKRFIQQVEQHGGAAKICGSGAVTGQQAGAVLVITEERQHLTLLCQQYAYSFYKIACPARGLHAA